jgi:hypothetical protein
MRFTAIFAVALLFALPVLAQPPAPAPAQTTCNRPQHQPGAAAAAPSPQLMAARRAMHQACAADMATYCSNVPRGCGAPKRCLMAHQSQLSSSCMAAWKNLRAARGKHG